ncbi:MAG: hypothetical protein ABIG44_16665 [Planctomycetota bacterium]
MKLKLPMGVIPMEIYASDYKPVDGVLIAHQARVIVMGGERLMKTESVEHNVKLPKDRFELPPEIKDIIKQQKAQDNGKAQEKKEPTTQP